MTIEEKIQSDASGFEAELDKKVPEIQEAMKELSVKLDRIINSAIAAYCEEIGAEMDINSLPTYKTMNKVITGKLDTIIAEYIKEKRKNL